MTIKAENLDVRVRPAQKVPFGYVAEVFSSELIAGKSVRQVKVHLKLFHLDAQKAYNAGKLAINAIYVAEVKEAARKAEADRVNSKNKKS